MRKRSTRINNSLQWAECAEQELRNAELQRRQRRRVNQSSNSPRNVSSTDVNVSSPTVNMESNSTLQLGSSVVLSDNVDLSSSGEDVDNDAISLDERGGVTEDVGEVLCENISLRRGTIYVLKGQNGERQQLPTFEFTQDGVQMMSFEKRLFHTIVKNKLITDHKCKKPEFCGKVGLEVSEHYGANWRCHPLFNLPNSSSKHQGKCLIYLEDKRRKRLDKNDIIVRCTNRFATLICLRCSTLDEPAYICSESTKTKCNCLNMHINAYNS